MKTRLWLLLAGAALVLATPRQVEAMGACTCARFNFWQDMGCNPNYAGVDSPAASKSNAGGNQSSCNGDCGMPRWWVSEPYINLWMSDTPLSYALSSGQEMAFKFYYRQLAKLPASDEVPNYWSYVQGNEYIKNEDVYAGSANGSTCGTNAFWGHNWNMSVLLWDVNWENAWVLQLHSTPPTHFFLCFPPSNPVYNMGSYEAYVSRPEGGIQYFNVISQNPASQRDPKSQVSLKPVSTYPLVTNSPTADANGIYWGDVDMGVKLVYPDGSQEVFSLTAFSPITDTTPFESISAPNTSSATRFLLTQRIDPQGRVTQLGYEKVILNAMQHGYRLKYVVDPDSRTNSFLYTATNTLLLAEIDDPYGRNTRLGYNPAGLLTRITDAAGLTNFFQYQPGPFVTNMNGSQKIVSQLPSSGWITNLSTPYGNTSFSYYEVPDSSVIDGFQQRAIYISEPEGAQQLYLYQHTNTFIAIWETSPAVLGQTDFDDGTSLPGASGHAALLYRNTFHWGRRQFAALSSNERSAIASSLSTGLGSLTPTDYNKARLRHWLLLGSESVPVSITESLSSERDPSPDAAGQIPGLRTWYNYTGKPSAELLGNNPQVSCVARILPDGSSQYTTYNYYPGVPGYPPGAGFVSNSISSYSRPDGTVGTLTNWFGYATNSIDLISVSNSFGQWWNLGYNTNHQINFITNALKQVATLGWDSYTYNLTGVQWPSGQSVSLAYGGGDYGRLQTVSWSASGRSFTISAYTNGLPRVVSDDRGVTVTNTWDGLNRLTGTTFPDGTSVSNIYKKLDLAATKDRLANWSYYVYDGLQHLTTVTNANQAVTIYSWCGCGSLNQIFDAVNGTANPTTLNYDNQGNLTNITYPDNTSLTYQFDLAGRMTNVFDGANRSVQLAYNNQGLVTNLTGAFGTLESIVYDAVNRPISITDANGITVNNAYDAINELLSRAWPDGISEGFGYRTNGLVAYTNRDQKVTLYGRDGSGRLTAVTNANQEVTQFGYDSLDNIVSLIDGLQHQTTWRYNEYGWLTNKVDGLTHNTFQFAHNANGWVTNRWTPEKGNTGYTYDNVGNLKSIAYPQLTISYAYDALNRLTNLVDAVGTTAFSYTPAGQLQSENGPWASDTVTNAYVQGLRTAMSLSQPSGTWSQTYGYDTLWRMTNIISPAGTFGYSYNFQPASSLVSKISLPNAANITHTYDGLARLKQTVLNNYWGHILDGYSYGYDSLGLRTNITRNLGLTTNSAAVGYDNIGQITSWLAKESGGAARLNEQFGFGFDAAHNLLRRTNNLLAQTFTVDAANQLTNVSRTGTFTLSGATPAPATSVTVNGQAAQTCGDFTFARTNLALVNGTNVFSIVASNAYGLKATNILTVNLPTNVNLTSDANGSLTNDGTRSFAYDCENQLTNVIVAGQWRSDFVYDGLGRRRVARDYAWQSGAWTLTNEIHYVYDGMLLVQERNSNNAPLVSYTRGLDLGGSLRRAGGIGGLLARTDASGSMFYHADALGNITALMDGNENIVARYLYNPFGKLIGKWGPLADANEMQFSSMSIYKGIVMYPRRAYFPELARFGSSDPIGERGGINLYRAMRNNPLRYVDPMGLQDSEDIFDPRKENGEWRPEVFKTEQEQFEDARKDNRVFGDQTPELRLPEIDPNWENNPKPSEEEWKNDIRKTVNDMFGQNSRQKEPCPKGGVYALRDPESGKVMYVGRSKNLDTRESAWGRHPVRGQLDFDPLYRTDNYAEQRGLEQLAFNQYKPPLNLINPIRPGNPNYMNYLSSAQSYINNAK